MSEAAAVDAVSGQTTDGWYEREKSLPIELADISLNSIKKKKQEMCTSIKTQTAANKHKMKVCACIYQYGCKWHNDGVRQHIPHLNAKPVGKVKRALRQLRLATLDMDPFCLIHRNGAFMSHFSPKK